MLVQPAFKIIGLPYNSCSTSYASLNSSACAHSDYIEARASYSTAQHKVLQYPCTTDAKYFSCKVLYNHACIIGCLQPQLLKTHACMLLTLHLYEIFWLVNHFKVWDSGFNQYRLTVLLKFLIEVIIFLHCMSAHAKFLFLYKPKLHT